MQTIQSSGIRHRFSWAASIWKAFAGWATSRCMPSGKARWRRAGAARRRIRRREDRLGLPQDLEDPAVDAVHICNTQLHAFPHGQGRARCRQAREFCEKPLAVSVEEARRLVESWRARPGAAIVPSTTCASTPWCSTCAA